MCDIFQKKATPFFDLFSQNSHFPLSLDMRLRYLWKAYWIRISARLAVDMDIRGYIHGYVHVWISDFSHPVECEYIQKYYAGAPVN